MSKIIKPSQKKTKPTTYIEVFILVVRQDLPREVWVFPRPLEHSEPWRRREEEGLPGPVEVLRHHDRGGHQGPEDVVLDVRDAEQGGAVGG